MSVEGLLLPPVFGYCGASGLWVQGKVCCCLGREEAYCVGAEEDLPSGLWECLLSE